MKTAVFRWNKEHAMKHGWPLIAVAALALAGAGSLTVQAQPAADFFKGKTISMVVSSSPGGGYDVLSRTVARHLPKHIPGAPIVAVRNMPGAGGIVATNYLYNVASKDGLTIGGVQNNTPFEPLLGTKEAEYDPRKFIWLGSPSFETGLLIVWNTVPVDNLEDVRKREITVSSSGANSTPSFYARLLNELLGTKLKIVVGYPGQSESFIAMERGEVDGYPSIFWSSLSATRPDWIKQGKVKYIVQYGPEKEKGAGDTPNVMDLLSKDEDKLLLEKLQLELESRRREREAADKQRRLQILAIEQVLVDGGLIAPYDPAAAADVAAQPSAAQVPAAAAAAAAAAVVAALAPAPALAPVREPVREMPPMKYAETGGGAVPTPAEDTGVTAQLDRMVALEEEARKKGTMTVEDYEQVKRKMVQRQVERDRKLRAMVGQGQEELMGDSALTIQRVGRGYLGRDLARRKRLARRLQVQARRPQHELACTHRRSMPEAHAQVKARGKTRKQLRAIGEKRWRAQDSTRLLLQQPC
jgi:tripartite-type tricarboxylate transporter receptor subunit TctC